MPMVMLWADDGKRGNKGKNQQGDKRIFVFYWLVELSRAEAQQLTIRFLINGVKFENSAQYISFFHFIYIAHG